MIQTVIVVAVIAAGLALAARMPLPELGRRLGRAAAGTGGLDVAKSSRSKVLPSDYIGTRYRSDLTMSETVYLWDQAVRQAYHGAGRQRSVVWTVPPFPLGYDPYDGERGIGGGLIPSRAPEWVLAIDVAEPVGTVYLAAWPEMVSMNMARPVVELWCVTPDDTYHGLERQRLEQFWNDSTLKRWGFVQRGLWGVALEP